MKYTLYPHQERAVNLLRAGFRQKHLRQVLAAPTGFGKTVVAAYIAQAARHRGKIPLFVVDRIELVKQAADTLRDAGLRVSILQGARTRILAEHDAIVGSIQTLHRRTLPDADFIIIDECHVWHKAHADLIEAYDTLPVIGLSATPLTEGLAKWFTNLVVPVTTRELTDIGFLVPVVAYGPSCPDLTRVQTRAGDYVVSQLSQAMNKAEIVGNVVRTWIAYGQERSTICFAVDIAHSKALCAEFRAAGYRAEHLDAYTDPDERADRVERFKSGDVTVLCSVACLSIGFDVPRASCAILARPTKSLKLHIQQIGRALRPYPGKKDAILLDHAGNIGRHGFPQDFDVGALDDGTKTWTASKGTSELVHCQQCSALYRDDLRQCPACGYEPKRAPSVVVRDGDLLRLTPKSPQGWYLELLGFAAQCGMKPGWAAYTYKEKFNHWPPQSWQALEPLPPSLETRSYARSRLAEYSRTATAEDGDDDEVDMDENGSLDAEAMGDQWIDERLHRF